MNNNLSPREDNLNLFFVISIIWDKKVQVTFFTILFSIVSLLIAISIQDTYESKTILAPRQDNLLNDNVRRYGNLASLAGVNIPSTTNKTDEAIEVISSLNFFENNIYPKIFLPDLMAFNAWSNKDFKNRYKEKLFNVAENKWIREVDPPLKPIPSAQESHLIFLEHLDIIKDKETGFINISLRHKSPQIANNWLAIIVTEINSKLRESQKIETLKSINYLNEQISSTALSEIRQAFSEILQTETQKMMLLESNDDFIFRYIEPPMIPEFPNWPNRLLIILAGTFFGFATIVFSVLLTNIKGKFDTR